MFNRSFKSAADGMLLVIAMVEFTPAGVLSGIARLIAPDEPSVTLPPVAVPDAVPVITVAPGAHIVVGVAKVVV
jgi:hypothetical protein